MPQHTSMRRQHREGASDLPHVNAKPRCGLALAVNRVSSSRLSILFIFCGCLCPSFWPQAAAVCAPMQLLLTVLGDLFHGVVVWNSVLFVLLGLFLLAGLSLFFGVVL